VVAQLACASLLLGGAGIMVATYFKVSHLDLGFDPRSLAYVVVRPPGDPMHLPSDAEVKAFAPPIKARLASVPGVKGVGTWGFATSRASWNELLPLWEDTPEGRRRIPGAAARMVAADTGFLQVVGISLRKGRTFTSADGAGSPPVAIVDEQTAARWWPDMDAVGRRLRVGGDAEPWVTVVGVIASTRSLFWTLDLVDDRRTNVIIRPWVQSVVPEEAFFFVRSAAPDARLLVGALRRAILPVTAGAMLLSVAPKSADYEEIYAPMRANTLAMLMLAGSGLVLALIGVYGVVAYTVAQRTQEIGIRVALGAQRTDVLPLVMTSSVVMALTGLGIGVLATLALRQAIRAALHNASAAASPLGVAVASVVFLGVVLLASYLPARRATRVDPMTALRAE
jgi:putative ABC transport system permease protein